MFQLTGPVKLLSKVSQVSLYNIVAFCFRLDVVTKLSKFVASRQWANRCAFNWQMWRKYSAMSFNILFGVVDIVSIFSAWRSSELPHRNAYKKFVSSHTTLFWQNILGVQCHLRKDLYPCCVLSIWLISNQYMWSEQSYQTKKLNTP